MPSIRKQDVPATVFTPEPLTFLESLFIDRLSAEEREAEYKAQCNSAESCMDDARDMLADGDVAGAIGCINTALIFMYAAAKFQ